MGSWAPVSVNVAGVKPVDPTTRIEVPDGAYRVECIDSTRKAKTDSNGVVKESIGVTLRHIEPDTAGAQHWIFLGLDLTKEMNRRNIFTALISKGVAADKLQSGQVTIGPDTFEGKVFYVYVQHKADQSVDEKGRKPLPDVSFITPELYTQLKARGNGAGAAQHVPPAGLGGVAGQLGGQPAPTATPVPIATPNI